MAIYNLGKILPTFKGEYQSNESYNRLDVVYVPSQGSYVSVLDNNIEVPSDSAESWVVLNKDITNAAAWDAFVAAEAERDSIVSNLVSSADTEITEFIDNATIRVNNTISGAESEMVQIGQEWNTLKGQMDQYSTDVSQLQSTVSSHISNSDIHVTVADKARWDAGSGSGFSGDYNDLINKPDIPDATSDLVNDSGFINQLKTINNESLIGTGNITIEGSGFSGSYNDLTDKPDFATVATSGSYNDLTDKPSIPSAQINSDWNAVSGVSQILNKPTLSTVATSGSYNDLSNRPNLANVATSGSYADLSDKPSIPAAQVNSDWNAVSGVSQILNKPTLSTVATTGDYTDLSNTPTIPTKTSDLTNDSGYINQLKTINNESLIGTGNITISSGGTQVQSDWTESDSSSMAYILHKPTLATVATSGSYSDLSNTPTIPTKTSDLTNDSGFVVGSNLATVATSGSYADLSNKPTIPTVNDATITITQGGTTKGTFTLNQSINSTIALEAGGGGNTRDTWYGSQAQFDAIPANQLDENTDYYISGNVQWNDIAGKPTIPTAVSQLENDIEYTSITTVKHEINKALRVFGDRVQYVTQSEYDSLTLSGALKDDVTYFIQDSTDNTIQMDVVFSDNTTATYNVYINN